MQDENWWKTDFVPTPTDDEVEASDEEGELDSVGRLFLDLAENKALPGYP